jgi:hypothetical protein
MKRAFKYILCLVFVTVAGAASVLFLANSHRLAKVALVQVDLPPGKGLVSVSWKNEELWMLLRSRPTSEAPGKWFLVKHAAAWQWPEEFVLLER